MNEQIIHPQFSIYNNVISNTKTGQVSLEEIVDFFKEKHPNIDRLRSLTRDYIAYPDKSIKKTIDNLKSEIRYITPGGVFGESRKNKFIENYSGVVQIDVDIKHPKGPSLVPAVKAAISKLPFVGMCAVSPSGVGVKAFAMTNNTVVEHHGECVSQINKIVEDAIFNIVSVISADLPIGKIIDDCAKAISQPMYLTFDPDTYYNPDYQVFDFVPVEGFEDEKGKKKKKKVAEGGSVLRKVKVEGITGKTVAVQIKAINTFVRKMKARPKTKDNPEGGFRHGTADAVSLIYFANRIGCDEDVVREWMINDGWDDEKDLARVAKMYRTYSADHGIGFEREVEVQAIIPEIPDNECLWIPAGGYLSDVLDGRTLERSTHIIAPTGSGKTHLQFEGPQIWVFPTTALCTQFLIAGGSVKDAWTVWGDAPSPDGCRDLIITTYDSFERVMKTVDVRDYVVVLDEVHNFVTASSPDYKLTALRKTLSFLPLAKRVITLTATPFPHCISTFADYDTMIVKKKDTFKRTVKLLTSEESRRADVVRRVCDRGNFALIFLQKTDRNTLIPWEQAFASMGKKAVFINSRNKGSKEFTEIVGNQQIDEGCVYVSTSVIAEGVSIQTELDVVDVYIMEAAHPFIIEQMSRRFRQIKELNVFLLTDGNVGNLTIEDLEVAAAECRDRQGKLASLLVDGFEASGLALNDFNFSGAPVYENANGDCVVDELLIENAVFQNECGLLKSNKHLVMELLNRKYGYEIVEEVERMTESAKLCVFDKGSDEMIEMAKNIAIGRCFGCRFDVPDNEMFVDILRKYSRFVSKIVADLPGITKLGQVKLKQVFDAFDVWNDNRVEYFINYVKLLNSGCEIRNKFRQLVMKYCVGVPLTSEKLKEYGSILFDHETLSASERKKSDYMSSVMMACEPKSTTIQIMKSVPKINSSASGDDVEVVGVEEVKTKVKVNIYTPVPERIAFEPDLMSLNIFGYENTKWSVKQVSVMTEDEQFRNELLTIPGFAF